MENQQASGASIFPRHAAVIVQSVVQKASVLFLSCQGAFKRAQPPTRTPTH